MGSMVQPKARVTEGILHHYRKINVSLSYTRIIVQLLYITYIMKFGDLFWNVRPTEKGLAAAGSPLRRLMHA